MHAMPRRFRRGIVVMRIADRLYQCYTLIKMKTAISIPDQVFKTADRMAKKLGISRSELYSRAVAEWIDRQKKSSITAKLNEVYSREPSEPDPFVEAAARHTLRRTEW